MKKLLQTFYNNQTANNLLIGQLYANCDSMKNIIGNCGESTSASNANQFGGVGDGRGNDNSNIYGNNNFYSNTNDNINNNYNNNNNNRMHRQFDDCL